MPLPFPTHRSALAVREEPDVALRCDSTDMLVWGCSAPTYHDRRPRTVRKWNANAEQITRRAHPPTALHRLPHWVRWANPPHTPAKCAQCAQLLWSLASVPQETDVVQDVANQTIGSAHRYPHHHHSQHRHHPSLPLAKNPLEGRGKGFYRATSAGKTIATTAHK